MNNQRLVLLLGIAIGLVLIYALPVRYAVLIGVLGLVVAYLFNKVSNKTAVWIAISLAVALLVSWGLDSYKKKEAEQARTAATRPAELRGLLTWHKEPGKEGINKELAYLPIAVRINHLDNSFIEFESINAGPRCIFTATKKIEEKTYSGAWSQQTPRDGGNFTLIFEDSSTAKGELWDRLRVRATITLRIF